MLDAKLLYLDLYYKRRQLTGPVNYRDFGETGPCSGKTLTSNMALKQLHKTDEMATT